MRCLGPSNPEGMAASSRLSSQPAALSIAVDTARARKAITDAFVLPEESPDATVASALTGYTAL